MLFTRFTRLSPGTKYVLDGKAVNDIYDALEADARVIVAPPLMLADSPAGKVLSVVIPPGVVLVRLTSPATAAGTYNGRLQKVVTNTQSPDDNEDLATWHGDLQTQDDCLVENVAENKIAAHRLTTGENSYVLAKFCERFSKDDSGNILPVYECDITLDQMGYVVCKGPCGEDDFTDNRYWVQLCNPFSGESAGVLGLTAAPQVPQSCDGGGASSKPNIVCLTNFGEANQQTHFARPGTPVAVFVRPDADGTPHYFTPYLDLGDNGQSCSSSSSSSSASETPSSGSTSASETPSSGSGSSGSQKSTAIVPATFSPTGYAALFVAEMPDVRFDDVIEATVSQTDAVVPIDPRFIEVCEPGTIRACGAQADLPVTLGAFVDGAGVRLRFGRKNAKKTVRVIIRLTGVRKGFAGVRFSPRTAEQFAKNEKFINSAY